MHCLFGHSIICHLECYVKYIHILYLQQQKIGGNVFFTLYPFQQCPDPTVALKPYVSQHPPELSRMLPGRRWGWWFRVWEEGVATTLLELFYQG